MGISPGGVVFNDIIKSGFETSPFLLKREMIQILGGSMEAEPFILFSELCVKGYLAARPYVKEVTEMVQLMMDSQLPCFAKGDEVIKKLRERFTPEYSEREAAEFMIEKIRKSYENPFTKAYDMFQKMQNDIPY